MENEHLDTILEKESDEFIKYSVKNLVPNPSESEDISNIRSECDVLVCDDFTTFSNLLFDADDNFSLVTTSHFLSLLNQDTLIVSSPKFDSLLEEFSGELAHIDLISLEIVETDFDPEEEIRFVERLLYDNSSHRCLKEFNSENYDAVIESFSPYPIPVVDSDLYMEEIDLFLASDGSIPPGIDSDYSDSEGDNLFLERLLYNDPIPLPNILDFSNVI
uniref:Reverse transcriptase domain-containing protein n=1 Tax=Tanacetum cinerariifolium TaxID=118510 RepID=A0A6L2LST8_TANCI|nr:hypothetical protein [Tanacetum cinerariifolium]